MAITNASLAAKKRILTACVRLFLEKGYNHTTVAEIIRDADVSASTFQNIFRAKDGVLVSDNVLQDGDVIESRFAVTRRNRTIHKRMREYLYTLTHSEELVTSVLPVGDGITLSTRR